MANLRDQILNKKDIDSEVVEVPEWGAEIEVRGLSGSARNRILSKAIDKKGNVNLDSIYPDLIIASSYDRSTGERIFGREDRDAINAKSGKALERITRVAMRLSGLDDGAVEDKVKN